LHHRVATDTVGSHRTGGDAVITMNKQR
ncbi:MAG: hypothetical protein QOG20_2504, partial [Pseudonocardiales bacterium]|nr:hypothetical protein [Pseudonocardiales bacterium]